MPTTEITSPMAPAINPLMGRGPASTETMLSPHSDTTKSSGEPRNRMSAWATGTAAAKVKVPTRLPRMPAVKAAPSARRA